MCSELWILLFLFVTFMNSYSDSSVILVNDIDLDQYRC
jgi:hypothetical protein